MRNIHAAGPADDTRRRSAEFPGSVAVVRSCAGYAFASLYGSLIFLPAAVVGWLLHRRSLMFAVGLFGMRVALRIAGIRYRVSGQGHLAAERGAVYCINHSSHLDVLAFILLYPLVPRLSILYKHELTSVPVVSSIFELADFIPLDRSHHDDAIRSLAKGVEALRAGRSLLTAPEGTRSPDGRLQSFKKGIFVMAIEAHVPIVPVAVIGAAEALPKGRSIARPGEIVVRIGEAIATDAMSYEDRDRLRQEALDRLRSLLRETPSSARAAGTYPI